ncbi:hypothetical protein R75461_08260 [Paraburkholderia nemoris]|uniref:hypothetical protein n=1 Tax=Paraburkholderia nemoris TaxID=2793076 RepID=UPI00190DD659|nr:MULTISPECIES: hypothetical protein [Paraburkholderia]MBK3787201.1 hypothetical protein [Paraburkholderia aspalathi]CAE6865655.1 hypothetical protein R75461_08260 [Paraburkholderia nemoris]
MAKRKPVIEATDPRVLRAILRTGLEQAGSVDAYCKAIVCAYMKELGVELPATPVAEKPGITNGLRPGAAEPELAPSARLVDLLAGVPRFRTFEKHGIHTLRDLARYSEPELFTLGGLGPGLVEHAKMALARAALTLRDE